MSARDTVVTRASQRLCGRLRRPAEPGQTTRWRAFAVLNQGKDIFKRNREFVRIEYSNPRVLQEIVGLNPGIEVTA